MDTQLVKYTQLGINKTLNMSIGMDGIIGTETLDAKAKMVSFLKDTFIKKGHLWLNDNLIGIRMNNEYTNGFTDFGALVINGELTCLFPMSTKPGIGKVLNPPTVEGITGVAVMKEGQYINLYQYNSEWWSGMPFLLQKGAIVVYRDSDLNTTITRTVEQSDEKLSYRLRLNFHSYKNTAQNWYWNLDVLSYLNKNKTYSNLSEGCQVVKAEVMLLLIPYLKQMGTGKDISYTLINMIG